jgi:hypothetical protein
MAHLIIGNVHTSLRLIVMRFQGDHLVTADYPIIGWDLTETPVPITLVNLHDEGIVGFAVHDRETKCWTTPNGRVHDEWKTVVAPIYAAWEASHVPRPKVTVWPMDQKEPSRQPQPLPRAAAAKPPGTSGGTAPGHR